jgi:predicted nucleic acid-binding protein
VIVDTDVLIWYSRGHQKAIDVVHSLDGFSLSVVTYMEIAQGVRNKKELHWFKKALRTLNAQVIHIDELISTKAMLYVEQYALSHAMELADALIGASAVVNQLPLLTGNEKHYKHLPDLTIQRFLPE